MDRRANGSQVASNDENRSSDRARIILGIIYERTHIHVFEVSDTHQLINQFQSKTNKRKQKHPRKSGRFARFAPVWVSVSSCCSLSLATSICRLILTNSHMAADVIYNITAKAQTGERKKNLPNVQTVPCVIRWQIGRKRKKVRDTVYSNGTLHARERVRKTVSDSITSIFINFILNKRIYMDFCAICYIIEMKSRLNL